MTRIVALVIGVVLVPALARAVTIGEIIELSRAGVHDVVLTALIDADRTLFLLDANDILELREAGVSDAVIARMIQTRSGVPYVAPAVLPYVVPYYIAVPVPVYPIEPSPPRNGPRPSVPAKLPPMGFRIRNGDFVR